MIMHSMRIPLFLCITSSDQHCIQTPIEATIMYHHFYMYWSAPIFWALIPLFILLTLLWAWVCLHHMPASSIYMSQTYNKKNLPYFERAIYTYPRVSAVSILLSPLFPWSYDVHRPYNEILPSHIKGKSVNSKKCSPISPWSKTYAYIIFLPYFPYFWPSQLYFHKKVPKHHYLLWFTLTLSRKG